MLKVFKTNKTLYISLKITASLILVGLSMLCLPGLIIAIGNLRSSIGSLAFISVSAVVLFFWWNTRLTSKIKSMPVLSKIYAAFKAIFLLGAAYGLILSVMILAAMIKTPPENLEATVIVPGCQVRGTSPSLMLTKRLQAAFVYLESHPGSACVVSGGQGPGEDISEAQAMKIYLENRGINPGRIYMEDNSTDTYENMEFSSIIIKENALSSNVVIATDSFHQFRCHINAKKNGLIPYSQNAQTPWWLFFGYLVREALAVGYDLIFN